MTIELGGIEYYLSGSDDNLKLVAKKPKSDYEIGVYLVDVQEEVTLSFEEFESGELSEGSKNA